MPSSTSSRLWSSDRGPALVVRGLTGPAGHPVIHDVDLQVGDGATAVVIGPIHSGKSSLARHLLGLERAERGSIAIGGELFDPTAWGGDELLWPLRRRVGVIFESSALLRHLTLVENVELPIAEHTDTRGRAARDAARELLWRVGVRADESALPIDVGRETHRRVALARALALHPRLLVLDEPTIGLDAHAAHEFDQTVQSLQAHDSFGVLILSREARHAFGSARDVFVLAGGRVVAGGTREEALLSEHPVARRLLHRRGAPR